ncbi:hypothetical protein FisN_10Lh028 [Fistulifera solaris]|uniref:Uncharacterized protein n=1 Tax=Fistulifera solaris TaxID=1519565 RepID=A0A1Z5JTT7_FISSO|nr:hypothetical protein FisN_10Lh028 [Fistulifera solaris]|eukprot:GAX17181.1 hypothetical protein FisN_10Lh028 [Fistulifera solaris]
MNSFSYTNPYTQQRRDTSLSQPDTPETLLQQLEMANAQTLEHRLPQLITTLHPSMDWKLTHIMRLVDWFFTTRARNSKNDAILALGLLLVNKCLQNCDVRLVYAAAVHSNEYSDKLLFLSLLEELTFCNTLHLRVAALSTLTTIWEALDRLQIVITCLKPNDEDTGWWIPNTNDVKWESVIKFVVESMGRNDFNGAPDFTDKTFSNLIRMDEMQSTCACFLAQLLHHQQHGWIYLYNKQFFEKFMQGLVREASRLKDANMLETNCTRLSLKCFQLCIALSEMQGTHERPEDMDQYSCIHDAVDAVVMAAFSDQFGLSISRWAQDALGTLFRSTLQPLSNKVTAHPLVRQKLQRDWSRLAEESSTYTVHVNLQTLYLMYYVMGPTTLQYLDEIIDRNDAARLLGNIARNIWNQIDSEDSIWAAGLYTRILRNGEDPLLSNSLSNAVKESIDTRCIIHWIDMAASHTSLSMSADYHTAKTICLLDMAFHATKVSQSFGEQVLGAIPEETFERLICSMKNKIHKTDIVAGDYSNQSFESEQSTPPANNLSRMDETCVLVEGDIESKGFDIFVRSATACLLASLVSASIQSHPTRRQQRIIETINDFVSGQSDALSDPFCDKVSRESVSRKLCLLLTMTHNGNENILLGSLLSLENAHHRLVTHGRRKIDEQQKELHVLLQRERVLQQTCESLERQVHQQSIVFQRQKLDSAYCMELKAKRQIAVHQGERNRAEQYVNELSLRVQEAEHQRDEYNRLLEECRESKHGMDNKLDEAMRQCAELKTQNFELTAALESNNSDLHRLSTELESLKHSNQLALSNEKVLREHVERLEQDLECSEEMNHELRDSLENIFSDMSKLARLYNEKEKEILRLKESESTKTESIERRLRSQETRNKEIQEQLRQMKYDNEVLSKKYAAAKEQMHKERKDRQKDLERAERRLKTSNISYINQLHQSSSSRSRLDKENESYRSYR